MRLRAALLGLMVLVAVPASADALAVVPSSRFPAPPPPATAPQSGVLVTFDAAVKDPLLAGNGSNWTVREVLPDGSLGAPLPGAKDFADDGSVKKAWEMTFPSPLGNLFFGSNAHYRVTLTNIQALNSNATIKSYSWDFQTLPEGPTKPPQALSAFSATLGDGGVGLAWSGPLDFDRSGVVVYRASGASIPTPDDQLVGNFAGPQAIAFDTAVNAGETYTYAAFPYDRDSPANLGPPLVSAPIRIPPVPPPDPGPPPADGTPPVPAPPPPVTGAPVKPARLLLAPANGVVTLGRAARLRWRKNPVAAYYNVQLFRGRRKIMSTFPTTPAEVIPAKLLRRAETLRVLIWSGVGARINGQYERSPWLKRTITVTRPVPHKHPAKKKT